MAGGADGHSYPKGAHLLHRMLLTHFSKCNISLTSTQECGRRLVVGGLILSTGDGIPHLLSGQLQPCARQKLSHLLVAADEPD